MEEYEIGDKVKIAVYGSWMEGRDGVVLSTRPHDDSTLVGQLSVCVAVDGYTAYWFAPQELDRVEE